jgi:[ribosomal protein S5]-alanine N-acetyltransferase
MIALSCPSQIGTAVSTRSDFDLEPELRFGARAAILLMESSANLNYRSLWGNGFSSMPITVVCAPKNQRVRRLHLNKSSFPLIVQNWHIAIMELKLRSCIIRPWKLDDAIAVQRYANNRKIWLNLRDLFPHPYSVENATAFLGYVINEKPQTTFAIALPSEAVGCIGLQIGRDVHRRTAELGYWLGEPFWGRGMMSEAVAEFTRHAFGTFDLDRIFAEPFANNRASARVLEKAGFVCEGRLRGSVFKDGQRLDSFLYARYETRLNSQKPTRFLSGFLGVTTLP